MKIESILTGVVMVIVAVVILTTVIGQTTDDVQEAGAVMNDSNLCANNGCVWNASNTLCYATSNFSAAACANSKATMRVPLSGLFNSTGVLPLVFLGLAFVGLLALMIRGLTKRN